MPSIARKTLIDKLPASELNQSLREFALPVTDLLPDARLGAVTELILRGIVTSQSPIVTQIARGASHADDSVWPTCQRAYRFLSNPRFSFRTLRKGLYRLAQAAVREQSPDRLVIAVDPVNFEKPYARALEGVSKVIKSTPPSLTGEKRLTRGYPAITATIVNLPQLSVTYAHWLSYVSADFISQNREVERALRMSRALFPQHILRFVGDAGLDDQKVFAQVETLQAEFVIRACHDRRIEVYNARLQRWESELLFELVDSVPFAFEQEVVFTHARRHRHARIRFGWFTIRLSDTPREIGVLVAQDVERDHHLVLLTNVPLDSAATVRQVYADWSRRSQIEHGYRFDQEDGLDVEDMRVETLERMRRLFLLVLLAAQFVYHIAQTWPQAAVVWLRILGGKLGLQSDRDGLYVLLRGISAVWQTAATLAFLANHPFPEEI